MPSPTLLDRLLAGDALAEHPTDVVESARRLAQSPEDAVAADVEGLPLPLAEAVLAAAVRQRVTPLVETLAASKTKALAKAAKKALYQLRSLGLEVQAPTSTAAEGTSSTASSASSAEPDFPCFVSPVNGTGERAVLLHRLHPQGSRVDTLYAVVSDEFGAVQTLLGETTRARFAKMVRGLRSEDRADVEIPLEAARAIVAEAATLNLATRSPFPEGFTEALRLFAITPPDHPFQVPPPEEGDARLAMEGHTLHEQPEVAQWMPSEKDLKVLVQKLATIESSPLQLTAAQRSEQLMQTLRDHARKSFSPEVRKVYSRRLWSIADHFALTKREHLADVARAEARRLAHDASEPFSRFAETMFEKVLHLMAQAPAGSGRAAPARAEAAPPDEKKGPRGLILSP